MGQSYSRIGSSGPTCDPVLRRVSAEFSICIPAYEMRGRGRQYLAELFRSIDDQTFRSFEVVVSDHSQDNELSSECEQWSSRWPLKYLRLAEGRGNASVNINNAVRHATGRILKPMHQDDFFHTPRALELISDALAGNPNATWGAVGFVHTESFEGVRYRYQVPYYGARMLEEGNTIGAPAVMFYKNGLDIFFDENLIWMNDAELYYRLHQLGGEPLVIPDTLVVIREWPEQVTHTDATAGLRARELEYSAAKHRLVEPEPSGFRRPPITRGESIKLRVLNGFVPGLLQAATRFQQAAARIDDHRLGIALNEDPLTRIANRLGTDKGTRKRYAWEGDRHRYTPIYNSYFESLRDEPIALLEIGVGGGQSVAMWLEYFSAAHIYAVDVLDYTHLNGDRVTTIMADQSDRRALRQAMNTIAREIDIVIDDGGHYMNQQQISLGYLFRGLAPGGIYAIEDLHTSYWPYRGYTSVYDDQPIDVNLARTNTTLGMVRTYVETKRIVSEYLSRDEIEYLDSNIDECVLYDTGANRYGPNHVAIFRKGR
jgi:glycosyltransferase involved in cell wall biosynthesis